MALSTAARAIRSRSTNLGKGASVSDPSIKNRPEDRASRGGGSGGSSSGGSGRAEAQPSQDIQKTQQQIAREKVGPVQRVETSGGETSYIGPGGKYTFPTGAITFTARTKGGGTPTLETGQRDVVQRNIIARGLIGRQNTLAEKQREGGRAQQLLYGEARSTLTGRAAETFRKQGRTVFLADGGISYTKDDRRTLVTTAGNVVTAPQSATLRSAFLTSALISNVQKGYEAKVGAVQVDRSTLTGRAAEIFRKQGKSVLTVGDDISYTEGDRQTLVTEAGNVVTAPQSATLRSAFFTSALISKVQRGREQQLRYEQAQRSIGAGRAQQYRAIGTQNLAVGNLIANVKTSALRAYDKAEVRTRFIPQFTERLIPESLPGRFTARKKEFFIAAEKNDKNIFGAIGSFNARVAGVKTGIAGGVVERVRDKPREALITTAAFFGLAEALQIASGSLQAVGVSGSTLYYGGKTAGAVLTGVYSASVIARTSQSKEKSEAFGSILAGEIAPMAVGGYLGYKTFIKGPPNFAGKINTKTRAVPISETLKVATVGKSGTVATVRPGLTAQRDGDLDFVLQRQQLRQNVVGDRAARVSIQTGDIRIGGRNYPITTTSYGRGFIGYIRGDVSDISFIKQPGASEITVKELSKVRDTQSQLFRTYAKARRGYPDVSEPIVRSRKTVPYAPEQLSIKKTQRYRIPKRQQLDIGSREYGDAGSLDFFDTRAAARAATYRMAGAEQSLKGGIEFKKKFLGQARAELIQTDKAGPARNIYQEYALSGAGKESKFLSMTLNRPTIKYAVQPKPKPNIRRVGVDRGIPFSYIQQRPPLITQRRSYFELQQTYSFEYRRRPFKQAAVNVKQAAVGVGEVLSKAGARFIKEPWPRGKKAEFDVARGTVIGKTVPVETAKPPPELRLDVDKQAKTATPRVSREKQVVNAPRQSVIGKTVTVQTSMPRLPPPPEPEISLSVQNIADIFNVGFRRGSYVSTFAMPTTRTESISNVRNDVRARSIARTRDFTRNYTRTYSLPTTATRSFVNVVPVANTRTFSRARSRTQTRTNTRTQTLTATQVSNTTTTNTVPTFTTPPPPSGFFDPFGRRGRSKRTRRTQGGLVRFAPRYQPSAEAVILNIRGKRASRREVATGLILRPLEA